MSNKIDIKTLSRMLADIVDPILGVWTPKFVELCLDKADDDAIIHFFETTRDRVEERFEGVQNKLPKPSQDVARRDAKIAELEKADEAKDAEIKRLMELVKNGNPQAPVAAKVGEDFTDRTSSGVKEDLAEMHHLSFKKKYGMTKEEYRAQEGGR